MPTAPLPQLPISHVLADIRAALAQKDSLVLEAPPGAGKTTLVPLELLDAQWLNGQKIVMLEPRRVAARAAAERMAELLGEPVGQRVGYRVRQEVKVSAKTQIEVVTGGIFTRWLQEDPSLDGVGLVIFDEFHERHLDSDLGLALCLQGRELFREDEVMPLKLLVMSATLNGDAVAELLEGAPIIRSEGRQHPVEIVYGKPQALGDSIIPSVVQTVNHVLREEAGSVLVFLPGQGEIRQVLRELESAVPETVDLRPLFGGLTLEEQRRAIAPPGPGPDNRPRRKVVLATDVAESSLTIEGVRVVIDAGRKREPAFDPNSGMTRLTTKRVSQASSTQRCGRAGRLEPGLCYRLWSEEQQYQLPAYATPEILQADLAPLALQLLNWGIDAPGELSWLNMPPEAAFNQALALLRMLGAAKPGPNQNWQITEHGQRLSVIPAHPRLAHLLLRAKQAGLTQLGASLAAILTDPPRVDSSADLGYLIALTQDEAPCPRHHKGWVNRTRKQAQTYQRLIKDLQVERAEAVARSDGLGYLLACGFPERIAKRRPKQRGMYQLSNGRAAKLAEEDALCNDEWLVCPELSGFVGRSEDRVVWAAPLNPQLFDQALASLIEEKDVLEWDKNANRFVAEQRQYVGALIVERQAIATPSAEAKQRALVDFVRQRGLNLLPWSDKQRQWQARVMLLRSVHQDDEHNPWPDVSDATLLGSLEQWLAPYLVDISRLSDFEQLDLNNILQSLLPWPLPQKLEELAPTTLAVPSGSRVGIDYLQSPPVLAVKLQELFGCEDTPRLAQGKVAVMVHLLSPARRPLQITQDLAGFWRTTYHDVKKEMKGRYPKHPWPDNPLEALPTKHVKARSHTK
jgi:ATP-dependent helicase HrpB